MNNDWKLTYRAHRWAYNTFERAEFHQTGDMAFTAECVDILLADPTVDLITLERITPVDTNTLCGYGMERFDNDGNVRVVTQNPDPSIP